MARPLPPSSSRRLLAALLAAAVAGLGAAAASLDARTQEPRRVVAIGDIHGDFDAFVAILRETGLIDDQRRWTGGRTVLVQTGDFSDRGDDVRGVMDLLMALERGARGAGGEVITLLGNHEVLVMLGEFRDVTPAICAAFADSRSDTRRERAWRNYAALAAERTRSTPEAPAVYRHSREAWLEAWPPGCLEYREALGPRGRYGSWLRSKPIAAVVDGTLFMHAGASPSLEVASVDELNARVRGELAQFDRFLRQIVQARLALPFFTMTEVVEVAADQIRIANAAVDEARARGVPLDRSTINVPIALEANGIVALGTWWLLAAEGPLWYRGYATEADEALAAPFTALLERLGVQRMAVGHTVTGDRRIRARLDERLFLIDTGMLARVYQGRPSALELVGGRATAVYLDRRETLFAR